MEYFDYYNSPLGQILLVANDVALTGLHFVGEKYYPAIAAEWQRQPNAKLIVRASKQLDEYFAGDRKDFDLPVDPAGTTFQRGVWRALQKIPYGATTNYGALAGCIGKPSASRAVGAANGRNPISIVIPCHRVIGANGDLTGYAGGVARKDALLRLEASSAGDFRLTAD
ncbi:MAG TPA: methylated-DNA--[protein]-cysteine S-methyltransferase [Burkholderiales bacterium]|nr:methylated-DNA--[protein]-cysteine S-methyltransferase [Burkholderiales bacterium]